MGKHKVKLTNDDRLIDSLNLVRVGLVLLICNIDKVSDYIKRNRKRGVK